MTAAVLRRGRHRVNSVQDIPPPTGNPQEFLSADLSWGVPADTVDYQSFTAAAAVQRLQPLALRADGKVELADMETLAQFNFYVGLAMNDAGMDETVHVKSLGRLDDASWDWQPRKPVFIGLAGQLTQDVPVSGYRQSVGKATLPTRIFLQPWIPVICSASGEAFFRQQGVNGGGGAVELEWATAQDLRDGVRTNQVVSPAVMKIVRDEVIAQYGLTAARKATLSDIDNGTPDKVVMAQQLKDKLDQIGAGGAVLEYATTTEIRAGSSTTKVINPAGLKPILDDLESGGMQLEYATLADINLGTSGVKVISPLAFITILNDLRDRDDELEGAIPAAASPAEVGAGVRGDAYVSPLTLAGVLDEVRAAIPETANHADILAGTAGKLVPADELKIALAALAAGIPLPAEAADIEAGEAEDRYVTVKQLVDGLAAAASTDDMENMDSRVTALENLPALVWATESEVLTGTATGKAVDPLTLQAKIDALELTGGGGGDVVYASAAEALTGVETAKAINPYTLAVVVANALAGLPALVWATESEVLTGTATGKAVSPLTLQAKIDALELTGGGGDVEYASIEEALAGAETAKAVNPFTLAIALASRQAVMVGEFGDLYPNPTGV
jgi:hypothetical protein